MMTVCHAGARTPDCPQCSAATHEFEPHRGQIRSGARLAISDSATILSTRADRAARMLVLRASSALRAPWRARHARSAPSVLKAAHRRPTARVARLEAARSCTARANAQIVPRASGAARAFRSPALAAATTPTRRPRGLRTAATARSTQRRHSTRHGRLIASAMAPSTTFIQTARTSNVTTARQVRIAMPVA